LSFTWQAIQVKEPKGKAKALVRGLTQEVHGLSDQLLIEISTAAKELLDDSLHGKDRVTQKALSPVRQMRDKLSDLSFLSPYVTPLVKSVDYTLSLLPKTGYIEGAQFSALYGLLSLLSDAERAKAHGKLINEGTTVEEAVDLTVQRSPANTVVTPGVANITQGTLLSPNPIAISGTPDDAQDSAPITVAETPSTATVSTVAVATKDPSVAAVEDTEAADEETCL